MHKKDETKKSKKHIHVILNEDRYQKFLELKKILGKRTDSEIVRTCIDKIYNSHNEKEIELRSILKNQLNLLIQNDYFRNRYLVLNEQDAVNDAVHQWIQNKRSEINLYHFPFRNSLSEDEKRVAHVFIDKQFNYEIGMTLDDIEKHLEGMKKNKIVSILKIFVENGLVLKSKLDNVDFYHAPMP